MKKITKDIDIQMMPQDINSMRYKDIGDWEVTENNGDLIMDIYCGDMKNTDYNFLVLLHELIESYLCYRRGITDNEVTKWDMDHADEEYPGDMPDAPYHKEHQTATDIESMIATELEVDWIKYEKAVEKTLKKFKKKK